MCRARRSAHSYPTGGNRSQQSCGIRSRPGPSRRRSAGSASRASGFFLSMGWRARGNTHRGGCRFWPHRDKARRRFTRARGTTMRRARANRRSCLARGHHLTSRHGARAQTAKKKATTRWGHPARHPAHEEMWLPVSGNTQCRVICAARKYEFMQRHALSTGDIKPGVRGTKIS